MSLWSLGTDSLIILLVALSYWRGYRAGLLSAVVNVSGLIISLLVAYWFYQPLANYVHQIWVLPYEILNIFSFILIAFVIDSGLTGLILIITRQVFTLPNWLTGHNWIAGLLGVFNGLITIAYLINIIAALPTDPPWKAAITNSLVAQPMIEAHRQLGSPIDALVAPAVNQIAQIFTVEPGSRESLDLGFTSSTATISLIDEQEMLNQLNQIRQEHGLSQLTLNQRLRRVAREHSQDMFARGYFSHYTPEGLDPFDRLKQAGIKYLAAGENLAIAPTTSMAMTGLMNSPGHRRNILDSKYRQVGIGAYRDGRYGIMFTQVFTN